MIASGQAALVLFADLDGILCDAETHLFEDSTAALDLLRRRDIPLILCSGKTRSQLERVCIDLGLACPFIAEHGGAVFVPHGYFDDLPRSRMAGGYDVVEFGAPYSSVVQALQDAAQRCRVDVIGFADMTVDDVARECRLPLMEARLAKLREYDEPFRVVDGDPAARRRLFRQLRARKFACFVGRRFDHVRGCVDLADGIGLLTRLYRRAFGPRTITIGFGVAPAHAPLLRAVDRAFIVRDYDGPACPTLARVPGAEEITEPGVLGWSRAIAGLVNGGSNPADSHPLTPSSA